MAKRPPAAQTAFGPMLIVACEQYVPPAQRLIEDPLAIRFLPASARLIVRACRCGPVRNLFMRAAEKTAPGLWGGIVCRKRYIDEIVAGAIAAGIETMVILGAGLDTRAYRLAAPRGIPTWEVDLAPNVEFKRARLQSLYGRVPEQVALVPIDLEREDLSATFAAAGFPISKRTVFVWEGVTQYLEEAAVRNTLRYLSHAVAGSSLVFTYVRQDFLDGTRQYGARKMYERFVPGRVWRFGLAPEAVAGLLREYGWIEREQAGTLEFRKRYLEPSERTLSVLEIERCVWAGKL